MDDSKSDAVQDLEKRFAEADLNWEPDVFFEERPWIPAGDYEMEFVSHACKQMQWGPKVILNFRTIEGEYEGTEVSRFYNATDIDKKGRPRCPQSGDFKKELRLLFPGRSLRQFAWKWFNDIVVTATIGDTGERSNVWSKIVRLNGARSKC